MTDRPDRPTPSAPAANTAATSSERPTCSFCKKKGHSVEKCWTKDPSKRRNVNATEGNVHSGYGRAIIGQGASSSSSQPDGGVAQRTRSNQRPSSAPPRSPPRPQEQQQQERSQRASRAELADLLEAALRNAKSSISNADILDGLNLRQDDLSGNQRSERRRERALTYVVLAFFCSHFLYCGSPRPLPCV